MILTHESGAQEDQFDEKKRRPKISWYYPFKETVSPPPVYNYLKVIVFKSPWYGYMAPDINCYGPSNFLRLGSKIIQNYHFNFECAKSC
jgi:hypothetical protein